MYPNPIPLQVYARHRNSSIWSLVAADISIRSVAQAAARAALEAGYSQAIVTCDQADINALAAAV